MKRTEYITAPQVAKLAHEHGIHICAATIRRKAIRKELPSYWSEILGARVFDKNEIIKTLTMERA